MPIEEFYTPNEEVLKSCKIFFDNDLSHYYLSLKIEKFFISHFLSEKNKIIKISENGILLNDINENLFDYLGLHDKIFIEKLNKDFINYFNEKEVKLNENLIFFKKDRDLYIKIK